MKFSKENIMYAIKQIVQKLNSMDSDGQQKLIANIRVDDYCQYENILNYILHNYPTEYTTDKIYIDDLMDADVLDEFKHSYYIITKMVVMIEGREIVIALATIPKKYYKLYTENIINDTSIINNIYRIGQKNNTMIFTLYSQFDYPFSAEE